jgi:DNA-binding beta-propeller fold protein YncE
MPCFAVSPDGQHVAAMSDGAPPVIVRIADGETMALSGAGPGERPLSFSADGKSLYVARYQESPARATMFRIESATGRRQFRADIVPADPAGVARIDYIFITPDGQRFAYSFHRLLNDLFVAEKR